MIKANNSAYVLNNEYEEEFEKIEPLERFDINSSRSEKEIYIFETLPYIANLINKFGNIEIFKKANVNITGRQWHLLKTLSIVSTDRNINIIELASYVGESVSNVRALLKELFRKNLITFYKSKKSLCPKLTDEGINLINDYDTIYRDKINRLFEQYESENIDSFAIDLYHLIQILPKRLAKDCVDMEYNVHDFDWYKIKAKTYAPTVANRKGIRLDKYIQNRL